MELRRPKCQLCELLCEVAWRNGKGRLGSVRFEREQSWLKMDGNNRPVLWICRGNGRCGARGWFPRRGRTSLMFAAGANPRIESEIYQGLWELPEAGGQAHFSVVNKWLRFCDEFHPNCRGSASSGRCMPTRVIDVGDVGSEFVRLWEPGQGARLPYVALSHPWGKGPHFVTNASNRDQHKKGIRLGDLPNTFRDAILATRAINIRYLWIDSICIVQGPGGDFDVEAKSMECVFSSAYVVLAASRSRNQNDGFLGQRPRRDYVTLFDGETPFYVCEFIDNFKHDVLDSHLNQRGWVLQEHALARRTVFFAGPQTYFECGDGVRCETLTKMRK